MSYRKIITVFYLLSSTLLYSCDKSDESIDPLPTLYIQDVIQNRTAANTTMRFYVYLIETAKNPVSVDYLIINGTAIAGQDFEPVSGTVTIPANEKQAMIDVPVLGDPTNLRQANLEFTVQLSNPKFCTLKTSTGKGTMVTENGSYLPTDNTGYTTPPTYPGYTLAWSDEFSGSALVGSAWNYEIGNGTNGWGNNELEYYTNSSKNVFLSEGNLIIEARKESVGGFNYSSARITTLNKKQFTYGRIDIRAKLPVDKGIWPALWMLGTNISTVGWPACGEIDIMELVGTYPSRVTGTMHWKPVSGTNTSKGTNYNLSPGDFSQEFHVFSIVWAKDIIQWYVDDQLYLTNTLADVGAANYPFNADHFFIFNIAVGGNWPGAPDATTAFPQRMYVDYIRVFQE